MEKNKKVKNATSKEFDGITFRSKIECDVYKALKEAGLNPRYEERRIILTPLLKPVNVKRFYHVDGKGLQEITDSIRQMTYTPDFFMEYDNLHIYIEVKGFSNDSYPLKKKLFLKYLEEQEDVKSIFFEIKNKREIPQLINLVCEYVSKENNQTT